MSSKNLFLSHSGPDKVAAINLKLRLLASPDAQAAGLKVWLDVDDLDEGKPWQAQLEVAIGAASAFAVIVGSKGIRNWVRAETDLALSRAIKDENFRIIPILQDGGSDSLTPFVKRYHAVRNPLNNPDALQRLLRAALGLDNDGLPVLTDAPFPGLRSMSEDWADRFFGRRMETDEALALLRRHRAVTIVADSGAGKSSLAMAGVGHAWRGGALRVDRPSADAFTIWHVVTMRPAENPIEQLRDAIQSAAKQLGSDQTAIASYREKLTTDPAFALRCGLDPASTHTLLIIDQAEELVTLTPRDRRPEFGRLIAALADAMGDRLRILITLRSDHLNLVTGIEGIGPMVRLSDAQFNLKQPIDLAEIVRGPLTLAGHRDEAEQHNLIDRLRKDLSNRPGDLALAQMTLSLAWRDRGKHGGLLGAYAMNGGALVALGREAERVERTLPPKDAERLMPIFIRLIRLSDVDTGATRRIAALKEFDDDQNRLIDRLAGEDCGRLVQTSAAHVEIAHEALITQWPRLHEYLIEHAGALRTLSDLIRRTQEWAAAGESARHLTSLADEERFQALQQAQGEWLAPVERRFLDWSKAEHKRIRDEREKTANRIRNGVFALALLIPALMGVGWFAYDREQSAQRAEAVAQKEAATAQQERQRAETFAAEARTQAELARVRGEAADSAGVEARRQSEIAAAEAARAAQSRVDALALLALSKAETNPVDALKLVLGAWPGNEAEPFPTPSVAFRAIGTALANTRPHELFSGHEGWVTTVAFSPDGSRIVSGGADGTIRMWAVNTGATLGEILRGHEDSVRSVAFSPDGSRIVSGGDDGTLRLWDATTGAALGEPLRGHEGLVWSVAFSPDGTRIVSGGDDGTLRLWDASSGAALSERWRREGGGIRSAAFSPNGSRIVSGSEDGTLRLWDASTATALGEPLLGHTGGVASVAFSPDGSNIVSGSDDSTLRRWDAATGAALGEPLIGHEDGVASVAFSLDGSRIVSGGDDGTLRHWDAATGAALGEPLRGHEGWVMSASLSPDGSRIVSGGEDGTLRLWEAATGTALGEPRRGHEGFVLSVAFSPDGRRILSGGTSGTLRLWGVDDGAALGELLRGHEGDVRSVAFSSDGSRIVSGGWDQTLRLWDAITGAVLAEFLHGHMGEVRSVAFSPNGSTIVSGSTDGTLRRWDSATGVMQGEALGGHEGWVVSVAFSPDGSRIISGSTDGTLRLWDAASDAAQGKALIGHENEVLSVAFSPDGRRIVSGGNDGTLHLWDAASGSALGEPLRGNEGYVVSVDFSPDGSRIVSGGGDGTLRLWDATTGAALGAPLRGHKEGVNSVDFSPDGRRIVSGGEDGTLRFWGNLPPGNILQIACRYLPHINGRPDISTDGLAAEIGIEGLTLPDDCDTYDPPLPPEFQQ